MNFETFAIGVILGFLFISWLRQTAKADRREQMRDHDKE